MGGWTEQVERRAAIIFDQMAAARALAARFGEDPFDTTEPYRAMLREIYNSDLVIASLLDRSDLVAWFEGKEVDKLAPSINVVGHACTDLQQQIKKIAQAIIGLASQNGVDWSPSLELGLSGMARGSLVVGVQLQLPAQVAVGENHTLLDENDLVYQAVQSAVRSLALITHYVGEHGVDDTIREEFPDPAVRDTLLVAAHQLAPSGRRGIDSITLRSPTTKTRSPEPLTPQTRKVLARAIASPLRETTPVELHGVVRAIDLDARRFELRGVHGSQTVRCLYPASLDGDAKKWLDQRVAVRGDGETSANGDVRLLVARKISASKIAKQATLLD